MTCNLILKIFGEKACSPYEGFGGKTNTQLDGVLGLQQIDESVV